MSCVDKPEDFCNTIVSNSDISGIGIRVSIYVQTVLSMTVASLLPFHKKAFRDTSRNTYVMSTSLMIAALVQWKRGGLSLFDGLVVTMLTTIMTGFVTINAPHTRTLGLSINVSSFLFTSFWCYWGLQVWANPSSFGLPGGKVPIECSANPSTIFVIFGKSLNMQNNGLRGFAIFVFAAGSIAVISSFWQCLRWSLIYLDGSSRIAKDAAAYSYPQELQKKKCTQSLFIASPILVTNHRGGDSDNTSSHRRYINRFGGLAGTLYMIITTEQIVARNPEVSSSLNQWTYSQTIALIMLSQQFMMCMSYAKEQIARRQLERTAMA